jgi:hypothetical protein
MSAHRSIRIVLITDHSVVLQFKIAIQRLSRDPQVLVVSKISTQTAHMAFAKIVRNIYFLIIIHNCNIRKLLIRNPTFNRSITLH